MMPATQANAYIGTQKLYFESSIIFLKSEGVTKAPLWIDNLFQNLIPCV